MRLLAAATLVASAALIAAPTHSAPRAVHRSGAHCVASGHAEQAALVELVERLCETAVPRVTAMWGSDWSQHVEVVVPTGTAELLRLVPSAGDTRDTAALEVGDRVVVDPENFARLSAAGRTVVMTHEITHVASRAVGPGVPAWLVEGLADEVGFAQVSLPLPVSAQELQAQVRAGHVPAQLPAGAAYSGPDAAAAYEQGWLAVRLIAQRYGQARLLRFYRDVGASGDLERAFRSDLGTSVAGFTAQSHASLVGELG